MTPETTDQERLAMRAEEIVNESHRLGELWLEARVVGDFVSMQAIDCSLEELRREGKKVAKLEHKRLKRLRA